MIRKSPLLLSAALLLALPGCWKSKKNEVEPRRDQEGIVAEGTISIFDEQENAFVLEDSKSPFTPEGSIRVVENESLWEKQQELFEPIYFEFDQYRIQSDQGAILNRTLQQIQNALTQGDVLVIEGHACNSAGSAAYNVMLSEKRAVEVKKYFVKHGFNEKQIKTVGRGFEMRKVPSGNREQQAPNRRVEFYFVRATQ
jgi:outer membrane protein OmpA-like peptidoglycan-associated protein